MPVPKTNYIHSKNGFLGADTDHQPADIDEIFASLRRSGQKRLIVHFHGGLVSKASGMDIAERLMPVYAPGGYPVFFVWESGALEAVRNNLADIGKEPIFQQLIRKLLEYTLARVGMKDGTRSAAGGTISRKEVESSFNAWLEKPDLPSMFSAARPHSGAEEVRAVAAAINENEIQMDLESDPRFVAALDAIGDVPAEVRSAVGVTGVTPNPTKMNAATLAAFAPKKLTEARGVISLAKVAWLVAKILARIIGRFANSRDHGFHATVVEEILRECYGDVIGQSIFWNQMKKDTADAFGGDPDRHVGTAFLSRLKQELAQGLVLNRIFLVGHSTGGIYISHFLDAVDAMKFDPAVTFDVILLAPANDHVLFANTLDKRAGRIRWLRLFGMKDEVEREDGLLGDDWKRIFYPSSLLYFVSGLLEDEPDKPILGMQRFLNNPQLFGAPSYEASDVNRGWLLKSNDRLVWSITNDGEGRRSTSRKHGDFDDDQPTLQSLTWIVTH